MYSDDLKVFDIALSTVLALLVIGGFALLIVSFTTDKVLPQHVHFLDTNECYDIKRSDVYKGVAYISFNDNTEIKCSAENVVVYVNHPCDYCDWGH